MSPPVRTMLVALAGVALLVPAIGVAAVRGEPPVTTPVETIPPPDPAPPVEPEPPAITITIEVPALPEPSEPAVAAPKRTFGTLVRPRTHARRAQPRRVERRAEPETRSRADIAPVAKEKPTPKAKPKKKLRQPQHRVIAPVSAPQGPIRDRMPAYGVLAAQFSAPAAVSRPTMHWAVLYLGLALATVLGMLFGLVGAAPVLAGRWPQVFVPVMQATERIVLAAVCLAGAAVTLAITWALTGPGA